MPKKPHSAQQVPTLPAPIRKPWSDRLRDDMQAFSDATGVPPTVIGTKGGNQRTWEMLNSGKSPTLKTCDRIYEWMASQGYHFNS